MRRRWALTGVAAVHRVGTVAVGEASVVIVASSAHRRAALEARIFTRRVGAKESPFHTLTFDLTNAPHRTNTYNHNTNQTKLKPQQTQTQYKKAVAWGIDELKATVPVWKKEFFADGSVWKENAEARRLLADVEKAEARAAA